MNAYEAANVTGIALLAIFSFGALGGFLATVAEILVIRWQERHRNK